ncbi:helix-turn-helix domain-containing protein [Nocardioides nanhaiensis]|uniref:helix-turn-helix domain-containing protein n=1 Tax=Nocardioides nanhaiensis TaxID=1476871 RepID=UPI0031E983BA
MPTTGEPGTTTAHRTDLGRAVRTLRQHRGMTLRQLAAALGVSPATVSALENGRTGTSTERVTQLADVLGVRIERLVGTVPEPVVDDRWARAAGPASPRGPAVPAQRSWREFPPARWDPALRGAMASFLVYGYHGSTMRGIAERAGLSVAGLYHYYGGKQQMLVALLERAMAELSARTSAALDDGADPAERLANLVECLALFHTHRRELGFIGATEMRSLIPAARHRIAGIRNREQRKVTTEVEQGCRDGLFATPEPQAAARAVVTSCTALAQWYRPTGPSSPEQVAAQYVEFALDVVRCRPAARPLPR